MIFIITILLLAADFYYLKNIAGRRLVGLRWWNEVDAASGDSKWVFESSEPGTKTINATDSRFFWLALYVQPLWWVLMAVVAFLRFEFLWLPLVGECNPFSSKESTSRRSARRHLVARLLRGEKLTLISHRPRPHRHEHPRLLPLRQVRPGFQHGWQRLRDHQPGR